MGDDQHGLALNQLCHGLLHDGLILRIDVGRGLVQNDNGRVFQHGPGDSKALALAAGQVGAPSANNRIIAPLQLADEGITAGGLGHCLHLGVRSAGPAHADVLPDGFVEEIVVLGHKGGLVVELGQRNLPQIMPAQGDMAGLHIPEAGNQLGDGGLAAAGGPDKGGHGSGGDVQADIMKNFLPFMIAEREVLQGDVHAVQFHEPLTVMLLLTVQNFIYRSHNGADLGQTVHEVHGRQQGTRNAQGENQRGNEGLHAETAAAVEQPARRKDGNQRSGHDRLGQRGGELAAFHPVVVVGGVGQDLIRVFRVGVFALVECLDDLDAADVFHNRGVHRLRGSDRPRILFPIADHNQHHKQHSHRNGDQREQRHTPVQHEQIDQNAHRAKQVACHLGQQMGQGSLHALHLIHNDLLHLAAGGVHDGTQGELGQFVKDHPPDIFQDGEGGLVGHGQRQGIQTGPQRVTDQTGGAPAQVKRPLPPPAQQGDDNLRRRVIGEHSTQYADGC